MLKDGEKGVVLQADKKTYALAPHIPCGVLTPELLRKIADVAEKYNAGAIKITGATRIALVGISEEDVDKVWADLGTDPGSLVGLCVRSVRACVGSDWCKLAQRDSLAMGLKLDKAYHGKELINKCKIAVSGCPINCAESWVRDIGLIGRIKGWELVAGGNVGSRPRIAKLVAEGLDDDRAIEAVAKVVDFYMKNAKRGERIGKMIERTGMEALQKEVS